MNALAPPGLYPAWRKTSLPSPLSATNVGKPSTPNFSLNALLAFFCASLSGFLRGKSTSTSTRFLVANFWNSDVSSASFLNLMHQPHQSDPVKSINTSLCSAFALACALDRSVNHSVSAAWTCQAAQ